MALHEARWYRFRHASIGGATSYVSLFVQTHVEKLPQISRLQRGIRHFLNASIKSGPPPKELPVPRHGSYYLPEDRLIPGLYDLPVLVSSDFHASGKGYRVLRIDELASIHGFPRHQITPNFPTSLLELPPCQLLSTSLAVVWSHEPSPRPAFPTAFESNPRPNKRLKDTETYLPLLKRYLAHDWFDTSVITATASKADNAESPCRLWD